MTAKENFDATTAAFGRLEASLAPKGGFAFRLIGACLFCLWPIFGLVLSGATLASYVRTLPKKSVWRQMSVAYWHFCWLLTLIWFSAICFPFVAFAKLFATGLSWWVVALVSIGLGIVPTVVVCVYLANRVSKPFVEELRALRDRERAERRHLRRDDGDLV